jgi:hypothetical protein
MEPLDFLRLVLPSPGHGAYCACELSQKKEHVFADTVEELLPHFERWVNNKANTFFALATFAEKGNRLAANARYVKSLFIDMDGYETAKDALASLDEFLNKTGLAELGYPYVVMSGGGLHVYWPFTHEVDVDTWRPLAENFKRLCKQEELKIDMTVTADAARVLRLPGTKNFKPKYPKPRTVRLLSSGDTFSYDALAEVVLAKLVTPGYEQTAQIFELLGTRPAAAPSAATDMFKNSITKFKSIFKETQKGNGCAQLEYFIDHATDDGMEPLWRGWLSIAKKCADGEKAGGWLSGLHPYPPERHRQKWIEIKGPYPCRKFDSENPGICPGCKHWGKITNPLALGREFETTTEEKEVAVAVAPTNDVEPVQATYFIPQPPRGYEYGKNGGVYKLKVKDEETGETKQVQLLSYTLYVMEMLKTAEGHFIHMVAMRKEGPKLFCFPAEAIATKDATIKALAKESVMAEFGGHDKDLYDYMRACVGLVAAGNAMKVPYHYGWQEDGSFAFAGMVFRKDKEPVKVPMPDLQNIVAATQPKGALDQWRGYFQMMISKRMYKHLAVFLAGTAAPLMRYTDFAGMTVHCCSTQSGTGKSLSLNTVSSVWGNPKAFKIGKGTSPVAMQHHLGLLNSLPLVVDEITENTRKDPEWFANFLLAMTEGKGKERMESGTNRERLNLSAWSSVAVMSSNTHAIDFLTTGRKHSAEGELLRLIEFKMDEILHWTPHERSFMTTLDHNHGVAGYRLAQHIVDNEERLRPMIQEACARIREKFNMTDDERHWLALVAASVVAAQLLKEANLVALPLKEILDAFEEAINGMRADMRGARRTVDDVLWEYIQTNYGQMVIVKSQETVTKMSDFKLDLSSTRTTIMGKVEIDATPGWTDFYIPNTLLRKHCADRNFAFQDFIRQIIQLPSLHAVPDRKIDMLAGTKIGTSALGRTTVLKISCRNEAVPDVGTSTVSVG